MRRICLLLFPILIAVLCASAIAAPSGKPETVLKDIQKAVDNSDMAAFERHVDMNRLLDQGSSAVVAAMRKAGDMDTSSFPPMLALIIVSVQQPEMAGQIAALLKNETASFVRYGVSSGAFAGKPRTDAALEGLIAPLMRDVSMGRKEFRLRSRVQREASGMYLVPATIHDYGNGRDYRVDLRVGSVQDVWRVLEIANIDTLLARLKKESMQ